MWTVLEAYSNQGFKGPGLWPFERPSTRYLGGSNLPFEFQWQEFGLKTFDSLITTDGFYKL